MQCLADPDISDALLGQCVANIKLTMPNDLSKVPCRATRYLITLSILMCPSIQQILVSRAHEDQGYTCRITWHERASHSHSALTQQSNITTYLIHWGPYDITHAVFKSRRGCDPLAQLRTNIGSCHEAWLDLYLVCSSLTKISNLSNLTRI